MKTVMLILIVLFVIGCCSTFVNKSTSPLTDDQCKDATVICWGERGKFPANVETCPQVYGCYDWELHAR